METKVEEIWKKMEVAPNYSVSNFGRIKNDVTGHVLKPQNDHKGYHRVRVMPFGTVKMHREVAKAFIPNPLNKPQVNHKDTNKQNNYVDNLEWSTNIDNAIHAANNGVHSNKWTPVDKILLIRANREMPIDKLAELAGVSRHVVKEVLVDYRG